MTSRATFGDLADAATRHLRRLTEPSKPGGQAEDVIGGMRAVVHAMARLSDDACTIFDAIPPCDRPGVAPWTRAAAQTREALQNAAALLPPGPAASATGRQRPARAHAEGPLHAAATSMAMGRDLLHTHIGTRPDGTRDDRSEWAPAITSVPVACALLRAIAGWARQIAPHASRAATAGPHGTARTRQNLTVACQWLSVLAGAVEAACERQPVLASERDLLHAIPVNVQPPRHLPSGSEPVTALCQGIISTAERSRAAAAISAAQASWSPAMTRESLRHLADHCTVTSWNCHLLLRALAQSATRHGQAPLAAQLDDAAQAADNARAAWLRAASAWDTVTTDTRDRISRTAADAADLALWTGRLAYATPGWTPELGPSHAARSPQDLAAEPGDLPGVIAAVHHACHTLATLAAATSQQVRTAAAAGRLVVPTRSLPEIIDIPYSYGHIPAQRAAALLGAHHGAATASDCLTATVAPIAAAVRAPSLTLTTTADAASARPGQRYADRQQASDTPAPRHAEPAPPGPAERALIELNITDPADLELAGAPGQGRRPAHPPRRHHRPARTPVRRPQPQPFHRHRRDHQPPPGHQRQPYPRRAAASPRRRSPPHRLDRQA